jgi:ubiquitin-protein ligase
MLPGHLRRLVVDRTDRLGLQPAVQSIRTYRASRAGGMTPDMYESPRIRRLRSDLVALEKLKAESSVFRFRSFGQPAQRYLMEFRGVSLSREKGKVGRRDRHEVEIKLGSSYPRTMPELRWLTPIYHPNISEIGMVCLGGYGTHWVPSLPLDELCVMLWDMARYHNYDIRSPYNRDAALWVAHQTTFVFPTDFRPLRDLRVALGRIGPERPVAQEEAANTTEPFSLEPVLQEPTSTPALTNGHVASTEPICILEMDIDLRPPREAPKAEEDVIYILD